MIRIKPDKNGRLTQWDLNRKVMISGIPDGTGFEVHFESKEDEHGAYVLPLVFKEGEMYAEIPNILLTFAGVIRMFIFDGNKVVYNWQCPVLGREKPDDYVYTETEVLRFESKEDLANKVGEITEKNTDDVHYPTTGAVAKYGALRYTTAQELTEAQKATARQNIDVLGSYEIVMTYDESTKRYSLNADYKTVYEDIFRNGRIPYITYCDTSEQGKVHKIRFYLASITNKYEYLGDGTSMAFQSLTGNYPSDNAASIYSRTIEWSYGKSNSPQVYENRFNASDVLAQLNDKTYANKFYNYQNYLSGNPGYDSIVANQSKYALARLGYYSGNKLISPIMTLESIDDNEIVYSAMTIDEFGIIRRRGIRIPASGGANYYESLIDKEYDFRSPVKLIENTDGSNGKPLRSLDTGVYVLKGYFTSYEGSTEPPYMFGAGVLATVVKTASVSYVQVFYSPDNCIWYYDITDTDVTWKTAMLTNMENIVYKVTEIDDTSDNLHYPSAKAVYDSLPTLKTWTSADVGAST